MGVGATIDYEADAVIDALNDMSSLQCALGETLTEPKDIVWFAGGEPVEPGQGVRLGEKMGEPA